MILSNSEIQKAIANKWLIIEPQPSPKTPREGVDCPYNTSSVDLRLGEEVSWLKEKIPINIDLREGKFAALFGPYSESCKISDEQPYVLRPGKFILAKTMERVELPINDNDNVTCLAARVEGRSSFARCGMLVHFTAPTIHAGWKGHITLEIINLGGHPIALYPGMAICQLIIEEVKGKPFVNESQFHNQKHPGGKKE